MGQADNPQPWTQIPCQSSHPVATQPCWLPAHEAVVDLVDGAGEVDDLGALGRDGDVADGDVRDPVQGLPEEIGRRVDF